jgi:uncharacterized protein (TIGR02001 family)
MRARPRIDLAPRLLALPLALLMSGSAAASSLSSTFTLASDYLFDGVSQTSNDPALQASLDYGAGGFYAGLWTSNVDFGPGDPADQEIDLYAGYGQSYDSGWGWSAGFAHYTYSGASDYRYTEWTAALTLPTTTTVQAWVADDDTVGGEALRIKAKHSFALPREFSLNLEATRAQYDNADFEDYNHFQVGVSRSFGPIDAYLGYSDTSKKDNDLADGRVLLTLATTVTWFE